jgi:CheY-like chemotaxis protein
MAKGGDRKDVLILDDEPEYLRWVEEYLQAKGLRVKFATNLSDGLRELAVRDYRLFLVDMNVPGIEVLDPRMRTEYPLVLKYPGLALAIEARNMGYGAHSVIAYTVHDDDAADEEFSKLHCRYVLKGRPDALKKVINSSLEPPPIKARNSDQIARRPRKRT